MILGKRQIEALWVSEGGSPSKADLASAVALGESGGDTKIYNGTCCYGLYQFNVNTEKQSCATNPVCATRKAIEHSNNGRDWGIWEAYTDGAYKSHYNGGKRGPSRKQAKTELVGFDPLEDTPLGPVIKGGEALFGGDNPIEGASNALGTIGDLATFFKELGLLLFTPEGWVRMAKISGGVILFFWGLRIVVREGTGTDPVKAATSTATKAAEAAATVAVVK